MNRRSLAALAIVVGVFSACSDGPAPKAVRTDPAGGLALLGADCDPLVPSHCGFPFPSSVYLADDPSTKTGKKVVFGATTLPTYDVGKHNDPLGWADLDGFSPGQAMLTHMPGMTTTGLPTQDTIARSLDADSPTIVLDASTGERVPHWAEIDVSVFGHEDERPLLIHPAVRLKDATRYIVAIRHVVDANGQPLAPSDVFRALRDGSDSSDPSVKLRRALYADIFDKLAKAGIDKSDLQIAWDYVTSSRENRTSRLIRMRDDALATVGDDGPTYRITNVEENPNPHIRRRITGMMTVPLYLDGTGQGARLVLGPDGLPKQNGTAEYEFVVHVPNSLANAGKAGPLVQNGHGLLGSKFEGQNGYLAQFADEKGYVAFAVDLLGMANEDSGPIANAIATTLTNLKSTIDRQHQGLVNWLLAMRMMKGRFVREPLVQFNGQSVIDPTQRFYRGDSQGGIFGTTYMAISTDVTRGLLGEPGMPYSLLWTRSVDFSGFGTLFLVTYKNPLDMNLAFGLIQMMWDRTEPDGYAPYITAENTLPNTPPHEVLIHVAIGDHQVTPLGAHLIARAVHAKNVAPVNREVWGVDDAQAPLSGGSAMVEFDFGLPPAPASDTPMSVGEDPHDKVRVLPAAMSQSDTFFRTGQIQQFCEGPCKGH